MTRVAQVLDDLRTQGDAVKAAEMAAYHKTAREFLGVPAAVLDEMARDLRRSLPLEDRCALAQALWHGPVHEGAVFAAKLLTQARIRPDDALVWRIIADWAQGFDSWALADHAAIAGGKRLQADLSRLDELEAWLEVPNLWTRRAALVMTLPFARLPFPNAPERAARARVLDWAARMVPDRDRFIQKAIAWWLRDLSPRDPAAVREFLDGPGVNLGAPARREANRLIGAIPPDATG